MGTKTRSVNVFFRSTKHPRANRPRAVVCSVNPRTSTHEDAESSRVGSHDVSPQQHFRAILRAATER